MGDTFSVFKRKSKPKFNIDKPVPVKKSQRVKVTSTRRGTGNKRSRPQEPKRAKRTLYEETINIDPTGSVNTGEYATASIDMIRARKRRNKTLWGVGAAVLVTALVAVLVWISMLLFFEVETVTCEGITLYDPEEIVEASGITIGQKMYDLDSHAITENLASQYPYLMNLEIRRRLPTGVVIVAEEDTARYYAPLGGGYYILSADLRVLETVSSEEEVKARFEGILKLTLPDVSRAVVGEKLAYFNKRSEAYIAEVLTALLSHESADGIRSVDLSSRFALSFNYEGRIEVLLGETQDIDSKTRFAFRIIGEFSEYATGTISAENVESGYAIVEDPEA